MDQKKFIKLFFFRNFIYNFLARLCFFNIKNFSIMIIILIVSINMNKALSQNNQYNALEYIFELRKAYPALIPTWHIIVPSHHRKNDYDNEWIFDLNGTTFPVRLTSINGANYFIGSVCMPHNCSGNIIIFMISVNSPEAYGLLVSDYHQERRFFGPNSPNARSMLLYYNEVQNLPYPKNEFLNDPFIKKIPSDILDPNNSKIPIINKGPSQNNLQEACRRFPNLCN